MFKKQIMQVYLQTFILNWKRVAMILMEMHYVLNYLLIQTHQKKEKLLSLLIRMSKNTSKSKLSFTRKIKNWNLIRIYKIPVKHQKIILILIKLCLNQSILWLKLMIQWTRFFQIFNFNFIYENNIFWKL